MGWRKGQVVQLEGLEARHHLNGRTGTLVSADASTGRFKVKLSDAWHTVKVPSYCLSKASYIAPKSDIEEAARDEDMADVLPDIPLSESRKLRDDFMKPPLPVFQDRKPQWPPSVKERVLLERRKQYPLPKPGALHEAIRKDTADGTQSDVHRLKHLGLAFFNERATDVKRIVPKPRKKRPAASFLDSITSDQLAAVAKAADRLRLANHDKVPDLLLGPLESSGTVRDALAGDDFFKEEYGLKIDDDVPNAQVRQHGVENECHNADEHGFASEPRSGSPTAEIWQKKGEHQGSAHTMMPTTRHGEDPSMTSDVLLGSSAELTPAPVTWSEGWAQSGLDDHCELPVGAPCAGIDADEPGEHSPNPDIDAATGTHMPDLLQNAGGSAVEEPVGTGLHGEHAGQLCEQNQPTDQLHSGRVCAEEIDGSAGAA